MMFCFSCKKLTLSTEPVVMKKVKDKDKQRLTICCMCAVCLSTKSWYVPADEIKNFPNELNYLIPGRAYINHINIDNKLYKFYDNIKHLINGR